ncbi:hypothetical protein EDD65_105131 [Keratinibaculum paraultunense]|uniref:Flagellar motility protein MotE (MotC chaperone) n=1 Tax=Keratinibaculum paraultunense TaxID=1278232 RepID=A0A4R3KVW7_9FIRM|nr:hypothetical protein [Keratinibaculum paraultunense]QQY80735.1 hypothetical protein JL105_05420 [Keratinibaculum paraultunense]TCS89657.1 hypothetical protein EDD65_105131 [Keratinibaculum paraultunense]
MENMENIEGAKKKKKWKAKLILIFVLIIIPLSILTFMYFNNKSFNTKANSVLSKLPGKLGYKFANSDDEDNEYKKEYLASYLLSLDPSAAVDKLYIIKKEDGKLYAELIKNMNSNSPTKTSEIITMIRNREQSKNLLSSMYDEIKKGKEKEFMDEINRLENQDLLITIKEITNRIENDKDFKDNLSEVFSLMNEDIVVDILYYLDEPYENEILYSLKSDKRSSIESKLLDKKAKYLRLADLARLYEVKPIEIAVEEIGNTDTYNMNELGIIYKNLSVLKSAEILSKINDDEFIQELFNVIRREEELSGEEESITTEISKTIQFMTEYNEKINDLVTVYEKMSPDKVAKIVEKMMDNDATVTQLEIFSEPAYEISDSSIVIDVLSRMKNKALSNIMNYISTDKASKLTQKLAEPQI